MSVDSTLEVSIDTDKAFLGNICSLNLLLSKGIGKTADTNVIQQLKRINTDKQHYALYLLLNKTSLDLFDNENG